MNLRLSSKKVISSPTRQRGAVMIVSLITLLVVTMIAVSSMRGSTLEEKMAGNTRDRNIAFQSAESAVREAEMFVEGLVSMGNFGGTPGLYRQTDAEPDFYNPAVWANGGQNIVAGSVYGAYQAPRYFIKQSTTVTGTEGALNMSGYGDNKGTGDVTIFRITARATGGSGDSAEVILRSQYGRIF